MSESLFDRPGQDATSYARVDEVPPGSAPLAVRMRPAGLDEVVGQAHLLGSGSPLRRLVEGTGAASVILYGATGTG